MLKKLLSSIVLCAITISSFAQNINIPDANFKAYLVGNTAINTNNDTEIQVSEATVFNDEINCSNLGITDLTGIEFFTSLKWLFCSNNALTTLDVSSNSALLQLNCNDNNLSTLNIYAGNLRTVICHNNAINFLIPSPNIEVLWCQNNNLTSVDLANRQLLLTLLCHNNELTSLDLDAGNCFNLTEINASNNSLTQFNVANGNNMNFTTFNALGNPNLACVFVDNSDYALANSPFMGNIDSTANFVETQGECDTLSITESELSNINIYPNPFNSELSIEGLKQPTSIKIYNMLGKLVMSISNTSIDTSKLPSGLYIITVETENGTISKKMIKQ